MRKAVAMLAIATVVGAIGGFVASRWWSAAVPDTIDPDWSASVRVLVGDGVTGGRDGGLRARLSDPFGITIAADGVFYVTDGADGHRIRRITPDGVVTTLAGGERGFVDAGGRAARFDTPSAIAADGEGVLYVADTANNAIRRITPDGTVVTIAGDGRPGYQDGLAAEARFNAPIGLTLDASGRVIVADTYNDRIRVIARDGTVTTLAGGPDPGFVNGTVTEARFDTPTGLATDTAGTIYVADTGNHAIRTITPDGVVSTLPIAGAVTRPIALALDALGRLYVADDSSRIFEVTLPSGVTRVLAGSRAGFADGTGVDARLRRPSGLASVSPGHLVVADTGNALIRSIDATAQAAHRPPPSPFINPRFDNEAFGRVPLLWPLQPLHGPFELAGTMGEARGESAGRFHAGIDVRADVGAPVLAVRDGTVATAVATGEFGTLNEWMRVGDVTYVHMRAGRHFGGALVDPARFAATRDERGRITRVRVKRGARFRAGDIIGSVNPFSHVHLNVGWAGHEYNPLLFRLVQFEDTVRPTIAADGIRIYRDDGTPLRQRVHGRLQISGRLQVVVDAWDQADGNRPGRRLGLYELGYEVLHADGRPVEGVADRRTTIRFDQIRAEADATRLVFAPGSGIPFYGQRVTRFLYVVTNSYREGLATQAFWDTSELPAGDYILRIRAADFHGNEAIARRDVPVTVAAAE